MERLLNHKLLIGLVVALVLAGAGGAYAATQAGTNSRQALLTDVAKRLNVSPAKLRSALQAALIDRLNAAVKSGQLTQAQANAIKQKIEKGGLPFGALGVGRGPLGVGRGLLGGRGFLFKHPGLRGQFPPPRAIGAFGPLAAAAKYLGISRSQLMKELNGKTLAQVAQARGKSASGLEQAIESAQKTRLDHLVSQGVLTKAQEQRQLSFLTKHIDRLVEHARVSIARAGRAPFPGGPGGPPARKLGLPGGPAADIPPGPPAGGPGVPPPPAA